MQSPPHTAAANVYVLAVVDSYYLRSRHSQAVTLSEAGVNSALKRI